MSLKYNFGGIEGAASAVQGGDRPIDGLMGNDLDRTEAGTNQVVELYPTSDQIDQASVRYDASTGDSGWMW